MKSNKKRKNARFPKWILDALLSIQIKYEWNFTEALLRCAEKGINYYEKQWQKMYGKNEKPGMNPGAVSSNCQEDNTQNEQKEIVTDEELDELFKNIFKDGMTQEEKDKALNDEVTKMLDDLYNPKEKKETKNEEN